MTCRQPGTWTWNLDLAPGPAPGLGCASARLRDLALAERSGLRVCVISYDDGSCELQVLHAGPASAVGPAGFTSATREVLSQIRSHRQRQ
jgi:hypothetical protein